MSFIRKILGLFSILLTLIVTPPAFAAGQPDASKVVDNLHQALLDVMKRSAQLGYQGRAKALAPIVESSFDFPNIARIVVGRYWSGLNDTQQKTFIDTFTRLSTATYASRFDSYSGESFRLVSQEPQTGDNVVVRTELVKSDGETVKLDYVVRPGKDNLWIILNVIADGISDLSLKRADYSTILKNEGFDALVAKLNDKIAQYEKPSGGK